MGEPFMQGLALAAVLGVPLMPSVGPLAQGSERCSGSLPLV